MFFIVAPGAVTMKENILDFLEALFHILCTFSSQISSKMKVAVTALSLTTISTKAQLQNQLSIKIVPPKFS